MLPTLYYSLYLHIHIGILFYTIIVLFVIILLPIIRMQIF